MWKVRCCAGALLLLTACAAPAQVSSPSVDPAGSRASVTNLAGPTSRPASAAPPTAAPSSMTPAAWAEDLAALDHAVRTVHVAPFTTTTEAEWAAAVATLRSSLPSLDDTESIVGLMQLVGLLDTHSEMNPWEAGFHGYPIFGYQFSDGFYLTKSADPTLVGARVDRIGETPIAQVVERAGRLHGADNESARLGLVGWLVFSPEVLKAFGIIADPAAPNIDLRLADGTTRTINPPVRSLDDVARELDIVDGLEGTAPEAVANRRTRVWSRLYEESSTFYIACNEAGADVSAALADLKKHLADADATRLVIDLRYNPGGRFEPARSFVNAIAHEERLNRPDRLAILIGREGFSAGAALASEFEARTKATFFGEPTATRPRPFLDGEEIVLPRSGLTVLLPTTIARVSSTDDSRAAIEPDVAIDLSAKDFFAGRDPVLDAALARR
jgi:hypothetical protein